MKRIGIGGGVMADKVKYGRDVVAHINPDADENIVNEWFRLIESAPEMLIALVQIEALARNFGNDSGWARNIRDVAQTAIARAEGRE